MTRTSLFLVATRAAGGCSLSSIHRAPLSSTLRISSRSLVAVSGCQRSVGGQLQNTPYQVNSFSSSSSAKAGAAGGAVALDLDVPEAQEEGQKTKKKMVKAFSDPEVRIVTTAAANDDNFSFTASNPLAENAIVFFHGSPGSVRDFRYVHGSLLADTIPSSPPFDASNVNIVRLNLAGYHQSDLPLNFDPTAKNHAEHSIKALLEGGIIREDTKVVFVGHSVGGHAAIEAASNAKINTGTCVRIDEG
jgi:pimeloyl-ACP methyl ester carboxylesterase